MTIVIVSCIVNSLQLSIVILILPLSLSSIIRIFSASFGMLRLATERIWKHVDDGNGRKFVIIMLLQKGNACVTQAHAFCVFTRKQTQVPFKLSWFVLYFGNALS